MLRLSWREYIARRLARTVAARLGPELETRIAAAVAAAQSELLSAVDSRVSTQKPWKSNLHVPSLAVAPSTNGPFMAYSTCSARDFFHPEFRRLCEAMGSPLAFHRKVWEWVFILYNALRTEAVGPSMRALGFAVGSEPLPAAFAQLGALVTATDAPSEIGVAQGWQKGGSHAANVDSLFRPGVVDRDTFDRNVTFAECDMMCIPPDLTGYDFCWSSCSFEHLGTLAAGLDFVVASVERTLKPGGVACHTTEFNLSSDEDTVETGPTVLYRRRDMLEVIDRLERRGHCVAPFAIAPDAHVLDSFVDTPPYDASPQLKLRLLRRCQHLRRAGHPAWPMIGASRAKSPRLVAVTPRQGSNPSSTVGCSGRMLSY